jgi:hypothetical protein
MNKWRSGKMRHKQTENQWWQGYSGAVTLLNNITRGKWVKTLIERLSFLGIKSGAWVDRVLEKNRILVPELIGGTKLC